MDRYARRILLSCCLLAVAASPLSGQVSTGRHQARPAEEPAEAIWADAGEAVWTFAAGAGILAGGDLFRLVSENAPRWLTPAGASFSSRDLTVTLDEDLVLAVAFGRRLGDRIWLRGHLGTAQAGLSALAWIGQESEVQAWDNLDVVLVGLDLEYRLTAQPRYPFLVAGAGAVLVKGRADIGYDQARPAVRFGGGYHLRLNRIWGLRAEARNSLSWLGFDDLAPSFAAEAQQPEFLVTEESPHHFWEIVLQFQAGF